MISERDYQVEDVDAIYQQWETHQAVLYVAATGLGKTVVMVKVSKRKLPGRTLFLCHRGELISQAVEAFARGGMTCDIEKADLYARTTMFKPDVVVATVQTLASGKLDKKRMHRFDPREFSLLLYDEVHHSVSSVNKSIVDYFMKGNPDLKVLGVTASADRMDGKALGQIFQSVASKRDIRWGIDNGWLVPIKALGIRVDEMDLSGVSKGSNGDLSQSGLAKIMEMEKPLYAVAQGSLEAAFYLEPNCLHGVDPEDWGNFLLDNSTPPRSVICFTASVKQAEMLSNIFRRVVPGISDWVCGETEQGHRDEINDRFKKGTLSILCNCGTHTEGVDIPRAEVVVPKPTLSRSLFVQMVGRPLRPAQVKGQSLCDLHATAEQRRRAIASSRKPTCIVLDFYGVSGKHKLVTMADALGGDYTELERKLATEEARAKMVPVNMDEEMLAAREKLRQQAEEARQREEAQKRRLIARSRFTVTHVNVFDRTQATPLVIPKRTGAMLSEKQRAIIVNKLGKDPDKLPIGYAKKLIGDYFAKFRR
jgi:superfamily II DNA or RNA helicase